MSRIDVNRLIEGHLYGVIVDSRISAAVVHRNRGMRQPRHKLLNHANPLSSGYWRPKGIRIPKREIISIFKA